MLEIFILLFIFIKESEEMDTCAFTYHKYKAPEKWLVNMGIEVRSDIQPMAREKESILRGKTSEGHLYALFIILYTYETSAMKNKFKDFSRLAERAFENATGYSLPCFDDDKKRLYLFKGNDKLTTIDLDLLAGSGDIARVAFYLSLLNFITKVHVNGVTFLTFDLKDIYLIEGKLSQPIIVNFFYFRKIKRSENELSTAIISLIELIAKVERSTLELQKKGRKDLHSFVETWENFLCKERFYYSAIPPLKAILERAIQKLS